MVSHILAEYFPNYKLKEIILLWIYIFIKLLQVGYGWVDFKLLMLANFVNIN